MPEDNMKILEEKNIHLWFDNSPLILCSMKLVLDNDAGGLFAYAKFMNVQPDPIRSVTVDIICYNAIRQEIDRITDFTYGGMDIVRNAEFGFNRKVPVRNPDTRNVEFVLKAMTNTIGQTWSNQEEKRFDKALEQESIFSVQGDLNKQFTNACDRAGIINSNKYVFNPIFEKNHWMCACGCFNWGAEFECYDCGANRDWLKENTNLDTLLVYKEAFVKQNTINLERYGSQHEAEERRKQREAFQERNRQYNEQQKIQKRRSNSKKPLVIILAICIVAALAAGVVFFGIPYVNYLSAGSAMSEQQYDVAIKYYTDLGDFLDSKNKLTEAVYGKAENMYRIGDKTSASQLYRSIEEYQDSKEKYQQTQYEIAEEKMESEEFIEAAQIFEELGNYNDSNTKLEQCYGKIYDQGAKLLKQRKISSAYTNFEFLGEYKNSSENLSECIYLNADILYQKGDYLTALEEYNRIRGYKDTDKILKKLSALSKILSAATEEQPAVWSADGMFCFLCNDEDSSTYSLAFSGDGTYVFKSTCENHDGDVKNITGRYKIEDNIIYTEVHKNGNSSWEKMLEIKSIKGLDTEMEGKNMVMIITNPFRKDTELTVYGNVISEDSIDFS